MKEKLNKRFHNMMKKLGLTLLSAATVFGSGVTLANTSADFDAVPPTILSGTTNTDPLVMLAMSNDQQLYIKAYTDYTDLNADGVIDITYVDSFGYYGYFDSNRCYSYGSGKFSPDGDAGGTNGHHCTSQWSGNFLNWATMTRMDVLRKVLYGGKRIESADTTSGTVLERAMIPTDVHAFVKTYVDTPANMALYTPYSQPAISMCNVTKGSGSSESDTEPPLLRVAYNPDINNADIWPGWSSNEVAQCLYRDENDGGLGIEPPASDRVADLNVRVDVCVTGKEEANCKTYSGGNKKPTGLLQKFGERADSPLRFGLMTGSYSLNMSGGVLRTDIGSLSEINSTTGIFSYTGNGIINTLSRFRISKYDFDNRVYSDCNRPGILTIDEGDGSEGCSNWGNPLSEIYMEAVRYFSGQIAPSPDFDTDDSSYIPSLPSPLSTWTDPLSSSNYCANCSIVVISTGLNSFDTDQMSSASGITGISGASDVNAKTDIVGNSTNENINTNLFLIGQSGTSIPPPVDDKQCTGKTVTDFSDARGICPEQPTLEGGYLIAGLAHHAHITDLRTDSDFPDKQNIDTYSISLAESLPSFTIPIGSSGEVTFSPFCQARNNSSTAWRACTLANVTVESLASDQSSGSMLFHWEDSSWGNDYDMDGVERISWSIVNSGTQVEIVASTPLANAGHTLQFGYTITGSNADGVKPYVTRPGGVNFNDLYPINGIGRYADTKTYSPFGSGAGILNNPLWYAAKYGSFADSNNNDIPDLISEWDAQDNTDGSSAPSGDGVPDNFFQVTNPALLEEQLDRIFSDIVARTSAGAALAVLSNDSASTSTLYQALYDPLVKGGAGKNDITWAGRLHALFLDDKGHIREDSDSNGKLDNYLTDRIVEIAYDPSVGRTRIETFTSANNGVTKDTSSSSGKKDLSTLKAIWSAQNELAKLNSGSITTQRTYANKITANAGGGRYIFTWVDEDIDNVIGATEVLDFTASTFDSTNFGFLNVATEAEANNIVDFIRGKEGITGFRSRTIDFLSAAGDEVWRLGDIIHSTPAVVDKPSAAYDLIYGDTSYKAFADAYSERRQVVYAGANDGMLHAFNGGFFDNANKQYNLTNSASSAVEHPLGSELWAYVPRNLLPHLKWLTETAYPHVYYVDGEPRTYDVNIFTPGLDAVTNIDHPNGWGTILVVGMRLGGGELTYDHDNDGTSDFTTRSSYIILDVTDPEVEPNLIAEISNPGFGFTTSVPSLVVKRTAGPGVDWNNPSVNNWYLVFGSGPTDLDTVTSSQAASIYAYDLSSNTFDTIALTGAINSFVGDPRSVDWGSDYKDDIVYFGTAGGTNAAPTGMLHRLVLGTPPFTSNTLMNPVQPFVSAPTTTIDSEGRQWVYAGSGRLFTHADNASLAQQSTYGIKEPLTSGVANYTGTVTASTGLQEVSTLQIFADSTIVDLDSSVSLLPSGTDTFDELVDVIRGKDGWQRKFDTAGVPGQRSLSSSVLFKQLLFFTAYTPPLVNACNAEGNSSLFAASFKTGTALPNLGLGNDITILNGLSYPLTNVSVDFGKGIVGSPNVFSRGGSGGGGGGSSEATSCTPATPCTTQTQPFVCPAGQVQGQDSTGALLNTCSTPPDLTSGRQSWRELDF